MQSAAFPELMPELTPISEALRRRLPRWDPRVWGGQEVLEVTAARRTGTELRHVGLAWARAHAQRLRAHQSHARTQSARDEATPPIRAQHAPAVEHLKRPARASTDLGGVGGPQAATPHSNITDPKCRAAEDRRRWATSDLYRVTRVDYDYPGGHDKSTSPYAQGGRILIGLIFGQSSLQELEEVGVAPGGELALGLDAFLVRALVLGKVHRDFAEQRDVFGPVVGSNA